MCAPAGAFSEPKIAPLGFSVPKIASFCVFNIEIRPGTAQGRPRGGREAGGGRGPGGEGKVWFRVHETILWDTSPDPADPPDPPDPADPVDPVPEPGLGPSLPHAPGARMTVVN